MHSRWCRVLLWRVLQHFLLAGVPPYQRCILMLELTRAVLFPYGLCCFATSSLAWPADMCQSAATRHHVHVQAKTFVRVPRHAFIVPAPSPFLSGRVDSDLQEC